MKILSHRGLWKTEPEKNTLLSFESAFSKGYGIETDIRDYDGRIVVSHNPPCSDAPLFTDMLDIWKSFDSMPVLALNVKADGLYLLLEDIFRSKGITRSNYFLFDSSLPEQYVYLKRGYNIYSRSSEFEPEIAFYSESAGVWLDQFTECGHIINTLPGLLASGKFVSVVSPELHKREKAETWEFIKQYRDCDNLFLCTDVPEEAEEYFK